MGHHYMNGNVRYYPIRVKITSKLSYLKALTLTLAVGIILMGFYTNSFHYNDLLHHLQKIKQE